MTAPPTTSECPPRYLVVECTTKSAPCSSGRWLTGVAKVLSTATSAPPRRATTPATSTTLSSGLVGLSTQIRRVSAFSAPATASRSVWSTRSYLRPQRLSTLSTSRNVPPYRSPGSTTWLPAAATTVSSACSAASPEEKATAWPP